VAVGDRHTVEREAVRTVGTLERREPQPLAREIRVVLQAHHRRDTVLVAQPCRVLRRRVLADQERRSDEAEPGTRARAWRRADETEEGPVVFHASTCRSSVGTPDVPERTVATDVPGRIPPRIGLTSTPAARSRSR